MSTRANLRRIVLDLTPMIDVIMILLFGVMINSMERTRSDTKDLRAAADKATDASTSAKQALAESQKRGDMLSQANQELRQQFDELEAVALKSERELARAKQDLQSQKMSFGSFFAELLQLQDADKLRFEKQTAEAVQGGDEAAKAAAKAAAKDLDPAKAYKAVRRIEEMRKVFTFVDVHIDKSDYLEVRVDGEFLDRLPARGRSAQVIAQEIYQTLEAISFQQMVLLLFSYDGGARDRTVEEVEDGVNALLRRYRATAGQGRVFRFGHVGLVNHQGG